MYSNTLIGAQPLSPPAAPSSAAAGATQTEASFRNSGSSEWRTLPRNMTWFSSANSLTTDFRGWASGPSPIISNLAEGWLLMRSRIPLMSHSRPCHFMRWPVKTMYFPCGRPSSSGKESPGTNCCTSAPLPTTRTNGEISEPRMFRTVLASCLVTQT